MTQDRWRQIEELYQAAQGRDADARATLLAGADPEIRSRVERMLELVSEDGEILDSPAAVLLEHLPAPLVEAGSRLGPYSIEKPIGAGGMGEVFRAVDTRLGRAVAIKVVREVFSDRFKREAQAISALNHPHICTLFDVGPDYLVMELLEGQTMRERIAAGSLSNEEICQVGLQMSEALEAAHSQGIVHRDIKPGNIFLTSRGIVKLLDFGLAKTVGEDSDTANLDALTEQGLPVGTVAYMSPEQARGREPGGPVVDARSDLFSFGIVLYEMATAHPPFVGRNRTETNDALLNKDPRPAREINPALDPALARIIDRALQKDPKARYQTASALRADLAGVRNRLEPGKPEFRRRQYLWVRAGAIAIALLAGFAGYRYFHATRPVTNPQEYVQLTNFPDSAVAPSLSPDGRMVTFIRGNRHFQSLGQIYVKALPDGDSIRLTDDPGPKYGPVFSPDGARVAYTQILQSVNGVSWDTMTVPVEGGPATKLLENASGLTWIGEHQLMFSAFKGGAHMGIVTASENRAGPREVYFPAHERGMAHYSYLSPDRKWVLIAEMNGAGLFDPCRLVPFDGSAAGRLIGPPGTCMAAGWSPDGRWMYFSAYVGGISHLWRQKFPDGAPEQITFGFATEEEGIAVAPDGRSLVTALGPRRTSVWVHDEQGDRLISGDGQADSPEFARDGTHVYYLLQSSSASYTKELRRTDLKTGTTEGLLPGIALKAFQISPDGREVVFTKRPGDGASEVWLAPLDQGSRPRLITRKGDQGFFDGHDALVFRGLGEKANFLFKINKDGSQRRQISNVPILDIWGVSADGQWVIGGLPESDPNTMPSTWMIPLDGGAPRNICPGGVCRGQWSPDGKFLYLTDNVTTIVFPVQPGRQFPDLPIDWKHASQLPGARQIRRSGISPWSDPSVYAYAETRLQRNLFRIPLH